MPYTLSLEQEEIIKLLCDDFITVKQVAKQRNTSVQAVYKTIKKLIETGYLKGGLKQGFRKGGMVTGGGVEKVKHTENKYYRLHGLQYDIKILQSGETFQKLKNQTTSIRIDNNTIVVYSDKIEVFSGENKDWQDKTINGCFEQAHNYYDLFFSQLENKLNIIILKDRCTNIKLVKGHLAEVEGGIAKEISLTDNLMLLRRSDGKVFFMFDKSKGLNESETIHPQHFKQDAQIIYEKQLRSWVEHPESLTNNELSQLIKVVLDVQKTTQEQLHINTQTLTFLLNSMKPTEFKENIKEKIDYVG
jgi:hypothetical protein